MLTEEEISAIAASLNATLDLPFIAEEKDQKILENMLNGVDDKLDESAEGLPGPVREIWERLEEGVSDDEAEELVGHLTHLASERIEIPFLSKEDEAAVIIRPAVSMIVDRLRNKMGASPGDEEA